MAEGILEGEAQKLMGMPAKLQGHAQTLFYMWQTYSQHREKKAARNAAKVEARREKWAGAGGNRGNGNVPGQNNVKLAQKHAMAASFHTKLARKHARKGNFKLAKLNVKAAREHTKASYMLDSTRNPLRYGNTSYGRALAKFEGLMRNVRTPYREHMKAGVKHAIVSFMAKRA